MRRKILWIVLTAAVLVGLALPALLKMQVHKGLEEAFPGAKVALGAFSVERPLALALSGVTVRSKGYDVSIGKVVVGKDLGLDVYDPVAAIRTLPETSEAKPDGEKPGTGKLRAIPLAAIRVHRLVLKYNVDGLTAEIKGNLAYDPKDGRFTEIDLAMASLKRGNFSIDNAVLHVGADGAGVLTVEGIAQQKLKLSRLRARAQLAGESIRFSGVEATLAGGKVAGTMEVLFTSPVSYQADLTIGLMDLAVLAKDLEIEAKVGLGGRIDGHVAFSGDAADMKRLTGELNGTEKGGDLIIHDRATLENLAKNVKQPIELVELAFKEYHFDTAGVAFGLDGNDLGLKIHLEGVKGKRDLEIKLHDLL